MQEKLYDVFETYILSPIFLIYAFSMFFGMLAFYGQARAGIWLMNLIDELKEWEKELKDKNLTNKHAKQ